MSPDETSLQLRVKLENEHLKKFEELKNKLSITTNTEMIRYIILSTWKNEFGVTANIEIHEQKLNEISRLIRRKDIRSKYHTYSMSDFINKGIERFFDDIKQMNKSILDWDIKSSLTESELEIALAFASCFRSNVQKGVKINEISEYLDKRNLRQIMDVMNNFEKQFLVKSILQGKEKIYFV